MAICEDGNGGILFAAPSSNVFGRIENDGELEIGLAGAGFDGTEKDDTSGLEHSYPHV